MQLRETIETEIDIVRMPPESHSTFQNDELLGTSCKRTDSTFSTTKKISPARLDPGIGFEMAQRKSFSFFIFLTKGLSPF